MCIESIQLSQYYYSFEHRECLKETIYANRDSVVKYYRLHDDDTEELHEWQFPFSNFQMISRLINMINFVKLRKSYITTYKRHKVSEHPLEYCRGFDHLIIIAVVFTNGKSHKIQFRKKNSDTPRSLDGVAEQIIDLCEVAEHVK
jgi:hypothetical protein